MFSNESEIYQIRATFSKSVFLAVHKPSSKFIAMKKILADNYSDEEFKSIIEEIKFVLSLNHQNIVKIHSVFVKDFDINVIYPFFCFGSCKEAMKNFFFTGFPEIIVALILRDVLEALNYLHKRGIIHRAIRSSHILLNQKQAVLSGFREATSLMSNGQRVQVLHR
jgi:STE20-related kinase adapter protein alpha